MNQGTGAQPSLDPYAIGQQLGAIHQNIETLKDEQQKMNYKLFGNGKVGALKELDLRVGTLEQSAKEQEVRTATVKWLARVVWWALGLLWGVIVAEAPRVKALLHWLGW